MNEFQLRDSMLTYMQQYLPITLETQKTWNKRLQQGVPIDPAGRYQLMHRDLSDNIESPDLSGLADPESEIQSICLEMLVNEENPFQVVFVYVLEIFNPNEEYDYRNRNTEIFQLGQEEQLLKRYNEIEVTK